MKNVAVCFYGQPRLLEEGFKYIHAFMNNNSDCIFDIFYHTWYTTDESVKEYDAAQWRNTPKSELTINKDSIDIINRLYKPTAGYYESPRKFDNFLDPSLINTNTVKSSLINNISNTLSCLYSCQQVRNVLSEYIDKTQIKYDFVVSTRFDFLNNISLHIRDLDPLKLYSHDIGSRYYIAGANFYISDVSRFLNFFNTFDNLPNIKDNAELFNKLRLHNEKLTINVEELITANYLYYYNDLNTIVKTRLIPFFR